MKRLRGRMAEAMEMLKAAKPHAATGARGFVSAETRIDGGDVFVHGKTATALERWGLVRIEWFDDGEYMTGDIFLTEETP